MKKAILLIFAAYSLSLQSAPRSEIKNQPLCFIENNGHIRDQYNNPRTDIQFQIKTQEGLSIFIGPGSIHYQFSQPTDNNVQQVAFASKEGLISPVSFSMYRMDVELQGANTNSRASRDEKIDFYENYTTNGQQGSIKSSAYGSIIYKDIYPNIDWKLYIANGKLKHEFVIHQGSDISAIRLKYGGASHLQINLDGSLTATTPQGNIIEEAPYSIDVTGSKINSKFMLNGNEVSYKIEKFKGQLIIDPSLSWGTYYGGGTYYDCSFGVATDSAGTVYMAGSTYTNTNIATAGAYQTVYMGRSDAFIAKFDSAGLLRWASYFGGSWTETGAGIATDHFGNVYLTGTSSSNGLATPGAHLSSGDTVFINGVQSSNVYLAGFDHSGALRWATYYGGSGHDIGAGVATDRSGNVYITGHVDSRSGIATAGAFQSSAVDTTGAYIAFLAKFDSTGHRQWGTYFGSMGEDWGTAVATDDSDNVFITGFADGTSPTTSGAYQNTFGGVKDAFIAKFNSGGTLRWASGYGGPAEELSQAITTDQNGNVFIAGSTYSSSGIATTGVHQTSTGGAMDCFLAKFSGTGTLLWGTFYGGPGYETAYAMATDICGNVHITGTTTSSSGIATTGASQSVFGGADDGYLARFNSLGILDWATYYGGSSGERSYGMASDLLGNVFISGYTGSRSQIATPGSYQSNFVGSVQNVFLAKFNFFHLPSVKAIAGEASVCIGSQIILSDSTPGGIWASALGLANVSPGGIVTGLSAGVDTISYTVTGQCTSVKARKFVHVYPLPTASISPSSDTTICQSDTLQLHAGIGSFYHWNTSDTTSDIFVTRSGIYRVVVTNNFGCSDTSASISVTVTSPPTITQNGNILGTTSTGTYQWYRNGKPISGAISATYAVLEPGDYTVVVTDGGCTSQSSNILITSLGIYETTQSVDFKLYPDPVQNNITISSAADINEVIITDLLGQIVYSGSYQVHLVTLDVSGLSKGIYVVYVNSQVSRFLKE